MKIISYKICGVNHEFFNEYSLEDFYAYMKNLGWKREDIEIVSIREATEKEAADEIERQKSGHYYFEKYGTVCE